MGKRSLFKRRPQDAYDTIDPHAVMALMPYISNIRTFAEPCCGMNCLTQQLTAVGLICNYESDILDGDDCDAMLLTAYDMEVVDAIITNPPWTRALLHALILHLQTLRPTWLLFDSDWAYNKGSAPYLAHCSNIVAVGRLCWIEGTNQTGKDNVSWYRFWHQHKGPTIFHGRS